MECSVWRKHYPAQTILLQVGSSSRLIVSELGCHWHFTLHPFRKSLFCISQPHSVSVARHQELCLTQEIGHWIINSSWLLKTESEGDWCPPLGQNKLLLSSCHLSVLHFDILASCPHGLWVFLKKETIKKVFKCSEALPQAFPKRWPIIGHGDWWGAGICVPCGVLGCRLKPQKAQHWIPPIHNPQTFLEIQNNGSNFTGLFQRIDLDQSGSLYDLRPWDSFWLITVFESGPSSTRFCERIKSWCLNASLVCNEKEKKFIE